MPIKKSSAKSMLSTASLLVLWAGSSISAQASDLVTTDQGDVLAHSVSATPGFGSNKSLMAGKDDGDSYAKTPLHVLGLAGLRNGESIATVKFDQPQNLHDFWRLKYQIASTTPIANVSVAIELVSEDGNFEGTTHWRQREQFQLPLSELSEGFLEIDSRIHVREFERRPGEFNNGSLLELVEVTAVNIVLIAKGVTADDDWLGPAWNQTWNVAANDWFAEDNATKNVADCAVW